MLDRVAFQIEKETQIKRRVKGAMIYPTMVLIFATLVLIGMLLFLVPIFVDIFADLNGELPVLTQYVVNASNFLRNEWMFFFPGCGIAFWGIRRLKRTEKGRQVWDRIKLKIPMKIGARRPQGDDGPLLANPLDARRRRRRHHQGVRDHGPDGRQLGRRGSARGRSREGAGRHADRAAARREPDLPADGRPHGQDR